MSTGPSPIRLIADIGPVKGASNPDLMCGLSAKNAQMVVPANPGSVFSVQWSGGDGVSKVRWSGLCYGDVLRARYLWMVLGGQCPAAYNTSEEVSVPSKLPVTRRIGSNSRPLNKLAASGDFVLIVSS